MLPDDSEHRSHNIYFDDIDYTDKDYYIDYPTIHHLMCELMSSRKPHDVRLVYLACAYLLGHRGHFLSEVDKDNIDRIKDFAPIYDEFIYSLENVTDNIPFDVNNNELSELIKQRLSVTAKEKRLTELLFNGKKPKPDLSSDIRYDCLIKLMSGGKVKLSDLFLNDEFAALESNSISVASADFLDTLDSLNESVSDDQWDLLHAVKEMNDWSVLVNICKHQLSKISMQSFPIKLYLKGNSTMINALYNYRQGDIHSAEVSDEFNALCIPFEESLTETQLTTFHNLLDCVSETAAAEMRAAYKVGFKDGATLIKEIQG